MPQEVYCPTCLMFVTSSFRCPNGAQMDSCVWNISEKERRKKLRRQVKQNKKARKRHQPRRRDQQMKPRPQRKKCPPQVDNPQPVEQDPELTSLFEAGKEE
jgi:hypothetical protein